MTMDSRRQRPHANLCCRLAGQCAHYHACRERPPHQWAHTLVHLFIVMGFLKITPFEAVYFLIH
nr:unknown [Populus trichocarpa]